MKFRSTRFIWQQWMEISQIKNSSGKSKKVRYLMQWWHKLYENLQKLKRGLIYYTVLELGEWWFTAICASVARAEEIKAFVSASMDQRRGSILHLSRVFPSTTFSHQNDWRFSFTFFKCKYEKGSSKTQKLSKLRHPFEELSCEVRRVGQVIDSLFWQRVKHTSAIPLALRARRAGRSSSHKKDREIGACWREVASDWNKGKWQEERALAESSKPEAMQVFGLQDRNRIHCQVWMSRRVSVWVSLALTIVWNLEMTRMTRGRDETKQELSVQCSEEQHFVSLNYNIINIARDSDVPSGG